MNDVSKPLFEAVGLTKFFAQTAALYEVSLTLSGPSVIGLIGRNGSGKTTLLRHVVGLQLPTSGQARTFGTPVGGLQAEQLSRIGVVPQTPTFLGWMTVDAQLRYLSRFYPRWDETRQSRLFDVLELQDWAKIDGLSAGGVQKLAIVAALCHHPELVLLDEPVAHLDPIVRERFLAFLLEVVQEDQATVVISSHVLYDIESIADWIVCLNAGKVTADAALDDLKERFVEWQVSPRGGDLPDHFDEPFIVHENLLTPRGARVVVRTGDADLAGFQRAHDVDVAVESLNLQGLFPVLVEAGRP